MSEWQTIDTAPKDGTWVLLKGGTIDYGWDGNGELPPVVVGQSSDWLNGGTLKEPRWMFAWFDGGYYGEYERPTHWQPLP